MAISFFIEDGFICPNPILGELICLHCRYTTFTKKKILTHLASKHKDFYDAAKREKNVKQPLQKATNSDDRKTSDNAQPEAAEVVGGQSSAKQEVSSSENPSVPTDAERTEPSTSKRGEPMLVLERINVEGRESGISKETLQAPVPMMGEKSSELAIANKSALPVAVTDVEASRSPALKMSSEVKDEGGRIKRKYNKKRGHDEVHVLPGKPHKSPRKVERDESSFTGKSSEALAKPAVVVKKPAPDSTSKFGPNVDHFFSVEERMELMFNSDSNGTSTPTGQLEIASSSNRLEVGGVATSSKVLPEKAEDEIVISARPASSLSPEPPECKTEEPLIEGNASSSNKDDITENGTAPVNELDTQMNGKVPLRKADISNNEASTSKDDVPRIEAEPPKNNSVPIRKVAASTSEDVPINEIGAPVNNSDIPKSGNVPPTNEVSSTLVNEVDAPKNEKVPINEVVASTGEDDIPIYEIGDPRNEADVSDDEVPNLVEVPAANPTDKSKMIALHAVLGDISAELQVDLPGRAGPSAEAVVGSNDEPQAPVVVNAKKRRFANSKEPLVAGGKKKKRFASLPDPIASDPPMLDQRRSALVPRTRSRFYVEDKTIIARPTKSFWNEENPLTCDKSVVTCVPGFHCKDPIFKELTCNVCYFTSFSKKAMANHVKNSHLPLEGADLQATGFTCGLCHREEPTRHAFSLHLSRHFVEDLVYGTRAIDEEMYSCNICNDYLTPDRREMATHVGIKHDKLQRLYAEAIEQIGIEN